MNRIYRIRVVRVCPPFQSGIGYAQDDGFTPEPDLSSFVLLRRPDAFLGFVIRVNLTIR